ncbi:MAG: PhnD/SsuA/transferrin family substrate-binding protein [Anaerolineales bacterium]|nr:PhnD/SsuA/transferrin family substrate-binding protein [Anaerolineales bacterium]
MTPLPLRFATFLAPSMLPVYQFIALYVGEKLGCPTELMVGDSFDQLAAGRFEAGFICGLPYIQLADRNPAPVELLAAPVLQGERFQQRPIYFSDVIVGRDSPFQTFADLRGCAWAYNEPGSHSGYNVTRYRLVQMGETRGFFGRVSGAGSHQNCIRQVAAGEADAAAIDSQVLAIALRDQPELAARLRIIDSLGPSPGLPVVAARHTPDRLKANLQAVLLEMETDPIARSWLARGFIERFAPVSDADYDVTREMVRAAEAVGFLRIR